MAGSALIGALRVTLGLDTAAFEKGAGLAERRAASFSKSYAAMGSKLQGVGAVMTVGITAPFTALVASAIPAAVESQKAIGQVNAALASMGGASGKTADQLTALAGRLQDTSLFDDDDILAKSTANLLTFGKISGDVFNRAQQAIIDYAARTGTDLQPATIMIAKALNDPIKGLTALSKVGVQFTADQKAMIASMVASGDTAGAQGVILAELERQYSGAAKAARAATPTAEMDQAWRTFQETVGGAALKVLPSVTNALSGLLNAFNTLSPGTQTFIIGFGAVAATLGPVIAGVGTVMTAVSALTPVVIALASGFSTVAVPAIVAFGALLAPILAPIAAVAGAIALVVAAVRHWDDIKAVASRVVGYMASLYEGVKSWLVDKLGAIFKWVADKVGWVGDAFFKLYDRVVGHSYIPDMVDEIGQHMGRLDINMLGVAEEKTGQTADKFEDLGSRVSMSVADMVRNVADAFGSLVNNIKSGDWVGAITGVLDAVLGLAESGVFGKGIQATVSANRSKVPGFATGGSFRVGGASGVDRNLVSFRATKGEMVDIRRPGQRAANDGAVVQLVVGEGQMFEPRVTGISGNVSVQTVGAAQRRAATRSSRRYG